MAWCRQATSHYLSQCWPSSMSPYGVTRPQWVKGSCIVPNDDQGSHYDDISATLIVRSVSGIIFNRVTTAAVCVGKLCQYWFRELIACCQNSIKTLSTPMLTPVGSNFNHFQNVSVSSKKIHKNVVYEMSVICVGTNEYQYVYSLIILVIYNRLSCIHKTKRSCHYDDPTTKSSTSCYTDSPRCHGVAT